MSATGSDNPRTISVVGVGRAPVAPDLATLVLGVETTDSALAEAQRENARRSATLRASLAESGLREGDIQTVGYHVGQDHGREGPTGHRVSNTVRATVREIARVGDILDTALAAGANQVQRVQFGAQDEEPALHAAREAAIRDARSKAEHYAALVGARLGAALAVAEGGTRAPGPAFDTPPFVARMAATPIAPGEGSLAVQVHVTYALLAD